MEGNRTNLFNDLNRTNIVGGKLPKKGFGKLQMISGQLSIQVHSKGNPIMILVGIIHYISCQMSHSKTYQLQGRLYVHYTIIKNLNRPISYSPH